MDLNLQILRRLNDFQVEYVVVGGLAAVGHGSLQVTFDVDVCVSFEEPNLSRIVNCVRDINPRIRMRPDKMRMPDPLPPGIKNLYLDTDLGTVDFLGEVSGIGGYAEAKAQSLILELAAGISCNVLDLDALIDAKRAAGRKKDRQHLLELEAIRKRRKNST
jgi:hypothetical protein